MQRPLVSRLAAIIVGTALCAAPAVAADAQNPYGNVNHRVDAGNNTGDSQVERLNAEQLRNIHRTSGYDARGGQDRGDQGGRGGYHPPYNDGRPGSGDRGGYGRPGYAGGYYGGYRGGYYGFRPGYGYGYGVGFGVPYYGGYGYGVPYYPAYYRPYGYFRPGFFGWGFRGGIGFGFRGGFRGRW